MKNEVILLLENWQAKQGDSLVRLYDFGDGCTVMPIPTQRPDGEWTYLTKSVCYLVRKGEGQPTVEHLGKGQFDGGGGWKFYAIEIPMGMKPEELTAALEKGKEELLEATDG